ncbi:MAG: DUF5110 domain-containing protein [Sedimentisphaerales bacterium]|nr:DUF5110 domain-containing protein [Sedimentisphaerales bacterium]
MNTIKKKLLAQPQYQPQAPEANTIVMGNARLTLLTSRLIRLEWSETGVFEDRATLMVVNRSLPSVKHHARRQGKTLSLNTTGVNGGLNLTYTDDGKPFHRGNLAIRFDLRGKTVVWRPGLKNRGNLGGTTHALDGVRGDQRETIIEDAQGNPAYSGKFEKVDLGDGFISRSGWTLIDDSHQAVLTDPPNQWVAPREAGDHRDWYFFGHGHDYKGALRDATTILGRQPLPPRYTLGYWWSRFWAYSDSELKELVAQFNRYQVPLDVMVIDMDWHLSGWTGYTWNPRYFPNPKRFIAWLKEQGLKVTLNLHPADGVARHEAAFPAMVKAMGLPLKKTKQVPFDLTNRRYMQAYFKYLHHPHERLGVDFWWMDWYQEQSKVVPGLAPLPWINHLHWQDMEQNPKRRNKRPLIFSRFGGYGANRYCVAFSGDTHSVWESLKFQPYFTATAANVLCGYWSHDIGGFKPGPIEPELYLRWVQFGVHSPILRTHTSNHESSERRVFAYPEPYATLMIALIRRRYEMIPYLYSEMRKCHDSGLSLCRPLYYDHPEENAAYHARDTYAFGDAMLVAPVMTPIADTDNQAPVKFWLPKGSWWDTARGTLEKGDKWLTRRYLLRETPTFVRPGTILPGQLSASRVTNGSYRHLVLTCWPGPKGDYDLYEDDGETCDYLRGKGIWIPLRQNTTKTGHRRIRIGKAKGAFTGFLAKRSLEVRLPASAPARKVRVDGRELPWCVCSGTPDTWFYDGDNATVVISVAKIDVTRGVTIDITFAAASALANGLKGSLARLSEITDLAIQAGHHLSLNANERLVFELAETGKRLTCCPETFRSEITKMKKNLARLPAILRTLAKSVTNDSPSHRYYSKALAILKSNLISS